jgi:hypothetical protein
LFIRQIAIDGARRNAQTMHKLAEQHGNDLWAFARRAATSLPSADAACGSGVMLPLGGGLVYDVSMSRTDLLARSVESGGCL